MLEELPPDMLVFADDDGEGRRNWGKGGS